MTGRATIFVPIRVVAHGDRKRIHLLRHPAGAVTVAMTWCGLPLPVWAEHEGGDGDRTDCRRCQEVKP